MRLRNLSLKKILAVIATLATLVNSLSAPALAFAQEVSPTPSPTTQASPTDTPTTQTTDSATPTSQPTVSPTDTSTPTATPDASITPTPSDQPSPTDSATPTATDSATPTDLASPTASPEAQPTDQPSAQPTDNSNQSNSQPTDSTQPSASLTPSPSAQPTATPQAPVEQGTLSETIITGVDLSGVTGLKTGVDGSGTITTNQSDYSPTSLVLITGSGFIANKTYTIEIVSTDAPPVNFTDQVKADNSGNISYAYQLDGNYRPNYTAYIKDGSVTVATTTFTDGPKPPSPSASLDQYGNAAPAGWQNGDLNANQATYREGDSVPYRIIFGDLDSSGATTYTVTIGWQYLNSSKHALDYLTSFDRTVSPNPCDGVAGCSGYTTTTFLVPVDPTLSTSCGFTGSQVAGNLKIYGGTITSVSSYSQGSTCMTGNQDNTISVSFTANQITPVLVWGGHIGSQIDWGIGNSASAISGSPYHMMLDSCSFNCGAQDRALAAASILPEPGLSTQISSANIYLGQSVTDTANYTEVNSKCGSNGNSSCGTVSGTTQFYECSGNTPCTSTSNPVGSPVTNSGDSAISPSFTPNALGTYCFAAYYTPSSTAQYSPISSTVVTNECVTVTNPPTGTLNVHKFTDTNADGVFETGDAGSNALGFAWGFDSTTPSNNANPFGTGITKNAGSYSVYENTVANYHFVGWYNNAGQGSCTNPDGRTLPASATVTGNATTNITLCNARDTGTVQVKKIVSPVDNSQWDFSISGPSTNSATLSSGQTSSAFSSLTGSYTVSETGHTGTTTSDYTSAYSCTDQSQNVVASGTGTSTDPLTLTNGESVLCTFTNTIKRGTVNVTKYNDLNANGAKDNGEPGLLGWTIALSSNGTDTTDSNGLASFTGVLPGTYTLSETLQGGWTQSNISCDNGSYDSANQNYSLTVNPGQTVNCTIGNYQNAQLTVSKTVISPTGASVSNDSTSFAFNAAGNSFNLSNGQSYGPLSLKPGTYSVSETANPDYTLTGCTNLTAGQITLISGQNATVTCTNQQKLATITVVKQMVLSDGKTLVLDGHQFTTQLNGDSVSNQTIAMGGTNATYNVNPGSLNTISEIDDPNYTQLGCKLPTGSDATNFSLGSNGSVTVTCTNEQNPGTISGYKYESDGKTGILGWTVDLLKCATAYDTCSQIGTTTTDASGFYSFTNLITGFYQVAENLVSTYTAIGPTSYNVTINPGTVSDTNNFSNFKNINITVCKEDTNGNSLSGWQMSLVTNGVTGKPTTQYTGDNGCTTFENLGPAEDYSVTETLQDNWTNVTPLTHDFGPAIDGFNPDPYTFVNQSHGTIELDKIWSGTPGETTLQIGTTAGSGDIASVDTGTNGTAPLSTGALGVNTGTYYVSENGGLDGYDSVLNCTDNNFPIDVGRGNSVTVGVGDTVVCTFTNTRQQGSLLVNKLEDTTGSGNYDTFNSSDFTWGTDPSVLGTAMGASQTLNTGNYNVYENSVPGYSFTGWFYGNPEENDFSCSEPEYTTLPTDLSVFSGETTEITLCNQFEMPTLNITKSNSTPNVNAGDKATYTLTVTNNGKATVPNITVKDVIPGGFSYVTGSTTGSTTSDPAVSGNVLTWSGVTIAAGQSWSITYQTQASSTLTSGSYTNFASCSTVFRDKTLKCDPDPVSSTVTIGGGTSYGGNIQGQVLGASTSVLPATGSPTLLLIGALSLIATGLFINGSYKRKERTNVKN